MSEQVPVEPPVYVETYGGHVSLTWTAAGVGQFLDTVRAAGTVPADTTPVVDATNAAGQRRMRLDEIDTSGGATTYVRVEPPASWTVAWERRTEPVVSLAGNPTVETCRAFHVGTTACSAWPTDAVSALTRLLDH